MQHLGEKVPYILGKENNRVDIVESDVKEKYVPA